MAFFRPDSSVWISNAVQFLENISDHGSLVRTSNPERSGYMQIDLQTGFVGMLTHLPD